MNFSQKNEANEKKNDEEKNLHESNAQRNIMNI